MHGSSLKGTIYVFHNRGRTALKLLVFDGQGFWLCHKRLSVGRALRGTCYRAANWFSLGITTGRGKADFTKVANRSKKYVLGLPLTKDFRQQLVTLP